MLKRYLYLAANLWVLVAGCAAAAESLSGEPGSWTARVSAVPAVRPVEQARMTPPRVAPVVRPESRPAAASALALPKVRATSNAGGLKVGKAAPAVVSVPDAPRVSERPATKSGADPPAQGSEAAAPRQAAEQPVGDTPGQHVSHPARPDRAARSVSPAVRVPWVTRGRPDKMALIADEEKRDRGEGKDEPGIVKTAFSMLLKLGAVLALAYVTILALKWLSNRRETFPRVQRNLKVVDTIKLSSNSSLHVIDVKGKTLLVGCSAGQMSLLQEFEQGEPAEGEPSGDSRFAEYLAKYSGSSFQSNPAGRLAGLLRDCAAYLQTRRRSVAAQDRGGSNEA